MATKTSGPSRLPSYPWIGKRPFYGWIIVAVGVVTQFLQGLSSQGFSTYLSFLQRDFGWSKAVMAGPRSVTSVEGAIIGPLEGFLVDKFGPRLIVMIGVFIMGLGFILFGLTNSLWLYYLANIIIALGTGFQGMIIMSVTVNKWFRRRRTIAQSIMLLGFSMAGVVGVPLLVLTQSAFGWQISAIGSGLIIWAVGFPCSLLLRTEPEPYGLMPDGDAPRATSAGGSKSTYIKEESDFTLREAVRTRAFWCLAFGWAIGGLGMGAAQVHLFLHLEQGVGLSATTSALVWTVASLSNIPIQASWWILRGQAAQKPYAWGLHAFNGSIYFLPGYCYFRADSSCIRSALRHRLGNPDSGDELHSGGVLRQEVLGNHLWHATINKPSFFHSRSGGSWLFSGRPGELPLDVHRHVIRHAGWIDYHHSGNSSETSPPYPE